MRNLFFALEAYGLAGGWTRAENGRAERSTYPIITPAGMRGIADSIHVKGIEFYNRPVRVEILQHPDAPVGVYPMIMGLKRNELSFKATPKSDPIIVTEYDQRYSSIILYPRYRMTFQIVPRSGFEAKGQGFLEQTLRRLDRGEQFTQPFFGCKEFLAHVSKPSTDRPIDVNIDVGFMHYDIFDLSKVGTRKFENIKKSVFRAKVDHGVMEIPAYDSNDVFKY